MRVNAGDGSSPGSPTAASPCNLYRPPPQLPHGAEEGDGEVACLAATWPPRTDALSDPDKEDEETDARDPCGSEVRGGWADPGLVGLVGYLLGW